MQLPSKEDYEQDGRDRTNHGYNLDSRTPCATPKEANLLSPGRPAALELLLPLFIAPQGESWQPVEGDVVEVRLERVHANRTSHTVRYLRGAAGAHHESHDPGAQYLFVTPLHLLLSLTRR